MPYEEVNILFCVIVPLSVSSQLKRPKGASAATAHGVFMVKITEQMYSKHLSV